MQISIPKEDTFYLSFGRMQGPFHDSGQGFETIDTGDDMNEFHQGEGLYGENSVFHAKSSASIKINSLLASDQVTPFSGPFPGSVYGDTRVKMRTALNPKHAEHITYSALLIGGTALEVPPSSEEIYPTWKYGSSGNVLWYAYWYVQSNNPLRITIACHFLTFAPLFHQGEVNETSVQAGRHNRVNVEVGVKSIDDAVGYFSTFVPEFPTHEQALGYYALTKYYVDHRYEANVDTALAWYRKFTNELLLTDSSRVNAPLPISSFGDLVQSAGERVNPDTINAIAFLADLRDVKQLVPKLKKLREISTHASNYLGVEYGILPTIDDLKTIWDSFATKYYYDQNGFQRVSSYDNASKLEQFMINGVAVNTTTNIDRRIHLAINKSDSGLDALTERVRKIGLLPSLTNLWDLIPYSFVLDWFVDVGSVLERIDTRHQLLNLDIKYCIQSQKTTTITELTDIPRGLHLEMTRSSYYRDVGTEVPQPTLFKENRITAQDHWIEGSALILARKPK